VLQQETTQVAVLPTETLSKVPVPEDLKNSRLFKAFSFNNSRPIQGLLPVNHSIAYNPTGTGERKKTPI